MRLLMFSIWAVLISSTTVWSQQAALPPIGLSEGMTAPDFEAVNDRGEKVRLADYLQKGKVVLIFFRGSWCVYCNRQLQEYQSNIEAFNQWGVSVIAVSVDRLEKAAQAVADNKYTFEIISNPEADLLELYNVVYYVPDDLAQLYKDKYKIDLEEASGRVDHLIAIPATYVLDSSGQIIYANANEDYKVRPKAMDILSVIEANKE